MNSDEMEMRKRRALWRAAHRGTKELDLMIGRYAAEHLAHMDEKALALFEAFLAVSDPDLQTWLLGPAPDCDAAFAETISTIRRYNGLI